MKKITVIILALCLVLAGFAPAPTEAKTKGKSLTVSVLTPKTATMTGKRTMVTYKGKTSRIRVMYGKKNVTKKAKYKSSKKKIFTVNKKGFIKSKKVGSSVLTIKYKKKTVKIRIYVKNQKRKHCSHNWKKTRTTSAPTCQKTGVDLYTCSKCKKTKNVTTPKTNHVYVNHICKYCGKSNIAKVNPTIAPPAKRWPYAKKLFSPSNCPQHFWEYDHCFYCNAPNPKPGINKGWDMSKKADHEHQWEGVYGVNEYGQLIATADGLEKHRCTICGIEEPWIGTERCNKCPLVWSSLEHPIERQANGVSVPYGTDAYQMDHADDHTDGLPSLAEADIYMTDAYFLYSGTKRSVYNPLYMQSNITGKTVWDTLGVAGKVWASYDTTRMNNLYHHTEDAWTAIPKLVNW